MDAAREAANEAGDAFAATRQARHDAFVAAFDHVAERIDAIYKDLTQGGVSGAVVGARGSACLVIQDRDSPYLGGITYNAMPPSKRFRDMDQLSGGEKVSLAVIQFRNLQSPTQATRTTPNGHLGARPGPAHTEHSRYLQHGRQHAAQRWANCWQPWGVLSMHVVLS